MRWFSRVGISCLLMVLAAQSRAEDVVRIAVATDFKSTVEQLTELYSQTNPTTFRIVVDTGESLYAKIKTAPSFDLLFSADVDRPQQLEREGVALPDTRVTYAIGKLVLWTPKRPITGDLRQTLSASPIRTVTLTNPATADGPNVENVLRDLKLHKRLKIVRSENADRTFQLLATGNADAGFITRAQVRDYERANNRSLAAEVLAIDPDSAARLEQQMVLLRPAQNNAAAHAFWRFVQSEQAQRLIAAAGYQSPAWIDPNCHGCQRENTAVTP